MEMRVVFHILAPVLLALGMNALIYLRGWRTRDDQKPIQRLLPPGYVIAAVWTVLLAILGYVHYRLYPNPAHWVIVGTVLYCISYPVLTEVVGRASLFNLIALILAAVVTGVTAYTERRAAVYTVPLLLWASYVNVADSVVKKYRRA